MTQSAGTPSTLLTRASFHVSAAKLEQLPPSGPPEICFVGRSNAGKSSAINLLTGQRRLAFSSKTPGRTRLINLFSLPDPLDPEQPLAFLVDLPGYGYAAIAKEAKADWGEILGGYLRTRSALSLVVLLLDIRRGLTDQDRNLIDWVAPTGRPVLVLLTKADKLPYGQRLKAAAAVRQSLQIVGGLRVIPFSATHRLGLEEASQYLDQHILPSAAP